MGDVYGLMDRELQRNPLVDCTLCLERRRAIITHGLYIFYSILHCGLYCRAVSVTDNLCTKQGNSSIIGFKIRV